MSGLLPSSLAGRGQGWGPLSVLLAFALLACHGHDIWPGLAPEAAPPASSAPGPAAPATPDPVATPLPSGGHPRLLLNDERLRAATAAANHASPSWNALVRNCREMASGKADSGYEGEQWSEAALDLAMCFRIRHDPSYGHAAVTYLMALVDDHENVGDHQGGLPAVKENDGYPIRHRGFFAALAYDWVYDLLSADQRKHVADRFVDFCHWYRKGGYKTDDPISNHYMGYFGACAMGGLALEGDDPRGVELRQIARVMWKTQIVPAYAKLPGGDFPEGWQYARIPLAALSSYVDAEGRARGDVKKLLADLPWLDETVVFQTHALLPDGVHQWDNADWSHKPAALLPESLYCAALALPKDDPHGDEALFVARSVSHVDGDSNWNWLRVLVDDGARKGTDPRHGPTSYVAHGTGTVMARTAWSADAAWVAMNSGPPWGDHQHLDQGHFEVVRGADSLIIDPGAYDAYSTMSHNSLLIDDHKENIRWAPNQGVWGKAAELPRSEDANGVVYAEADFGAAYDPDGYPQDNPERSVLRAERELVFSRTPLTGAHGTSARLVLYDRVTLAKTKYGVTWEMHTPVVPSVSANVATVGVGKSSVVVTTLLPVAKSAQLKEPTVHIDNMFEQNDVADGISSTRTEEESARGAIERRFLHVIAIGAAGDALPPAVHVDGEGAEGAAIDGETYVFPVAGPQKTAGPLAWRAPPTASKQIVTGLAPGGHYTASAATAGDVFRVALKPGGPLAASAAGTLAIDARDCAIH